MSFVSGFFYNLMMTIEDINRQIQTLPQTAFGVSVPALRKLAREIARADYRGFIKQNPNNSFELKMLHAFVLGYAKDDIGVLLKSFEEFIPQVDGWAVNDALCQNFKIARRYLDVVWKFLMKYRRSKKEFESRVVAVMLLSHFLTDEYIDRVLDVLNTLDTGAYYSQMGVAWAVATAMGKYPHKCMAFLRSPTCRLDGATYQKSLQKIRESFRVSDFIKQQTWKLAK